MEEVPEDWKKANVTTDFKKGNKCDLRNCRFRCFTLILGKMMEKKILETVFKHFVKKKVIGSSRREVTKGKSGPVSRYDQVVTLQYVNSKWDI